MKYSENLIPMPDILHAYPGFLAPGADHFRLLLHKLWFPIALGTSANIGMAALYELQHRQGHQIPALPAHSCFVMKGKEGQGFSHIFHDFPLDILGKRLHDTPQHAVPHAMSQGKLPCFFTGRTPKFPYHTHSLFLLTRPEDSGYSEVPDWPGPAWPARFGAESGCAHAL